MGEEVVHEDIIGIGTHLCNSVFCQQCNKTTYQAFSVSAASWICTKCGRETRPVAYVQCPACDGTDVRYEADLRYWFCMNEDCYSHFRTPYAYSEDHEPMYY